MIELLEGAFDADIFDRSVRFSDTGGIEEAESDPSEADCVFDNVAGCTVDIADNRFILIQHAV